MFFYVPHNKLRCKRWLGKQQGNEIGKADPPKPWEDLRNPPLLRSSPAHCTVKALFCNLEQLKL